ncbi:MAG TPA: 50S ribosomal protein L10 [Holophagaceae bacterium]|nr:50S ribosomal protein L10 [Holophagaceae bacterium]
MEKTLKTAEIAALKETFSGATTAVVLEFKGLTVEKDTAFRKSIREGKASYRVGKNTLMRLAAKDTPVEPLAASFKGNSSVAVTQSDVIALAKALNDFLKDNPAATFKAGVMDGKQITMKDIEQLANLPSRDQLIAKLLYLMKYPISGLAVALEGVRKQKAGE